MGGPAGKRESHGGWVSREVREQSRAKRKKKRQRVVGSTKKKRQSCMHDIN